MKLPRRTKSFERSDDDLESNIQVFHAAATSRVHRNSASVDRKRKSVGRSTSFRSWHPATDRLMMLNRRFQGKADLHGRVASPASVEDGPERTQHIFRPSLAG